MPPVQIQPVRRSYSFIHKTGADEQLVRKAGRMRARSLSRARELSTNLPGTSKNPFSSAPNPGSCSRAERRLAPSRAFHLRLLYMLFRRRLGFSGQARLMAASRGTWLLSLFKFKLFVLVNKNDTGQWP